MAVETRVDSDSSSTRGRRVSLTDRQPLSTWVTDPPSVSSRRLAGKIIVPYFSLIFLLAVLLVTAIDESGARLQSVLMALFAAAALVAIGVGFLAAKRSSRPVQMLVHATERIRRNELELQLPVPTEDTTGALTAAFNEMTDVLRECERARAAIERYMSPKVYELIQNGQMEMGGASREITVVKTDIRDFTSIAERMQPTALIAFLNRYFERVVAPVTKYEGEVDKYMGDAILAKFGATDWYPDHARRAVLAMIEMIEACDALTDELRWEGLPPIRMAIGANTGEAVVGNLGSTERMDYTIVSYAVNTAQRIEEMSKELGWDLLISEATHQQACDAIEVGQPWSVVLRGQTHTTLLYPVLGRKGDVSPQRQAAYQALRATREPMAVPCGAGSSS